jgi:hypothetical protein
MLSAGACILGVSLSIFLLAAIPTMLVSPALSCIWGTHYQRQPSASYALLHVQLKSSSGS